MYRKTNKFDKKTGNPANNAQRLQQNGQRPGIQTNNFNKPNKLTTYRNLKWAKMRCNQRQDRKLI